MTTKTIECPSGFSGEIRNLKAKEISILANPANRQRRASNKTKIAHPLDPVYAGCWMHTINPGPYPFKEGEPVDWSKVLVCDRFWTLLQIRDATWGSYNFKVKCPNSMCPRSKRGFIWCLDLNALEVKPLPPESVEKVRKGDRIFEIEVEGKKCQFKLLNGEDEANTPTLADDVPDDDKMLAGIATRIFMVQGIDNDKARIEWIGELDVPVLYDLQERLDAHDGGVETRTTIICPEGECGEEFTIDIPFGEAAFLTPDRKTRSLNRS